MINVTWGLFLFQNQSVEAPVEVEARAPGRVPLGQMTDASDATHTPLADLWGFVSGAIRPAKGA